METDYNALDDTLAGQCVQAGFIAAFCAFPAARVPLAVANVAAVAAANARAEDSEHDLTAHVDEAQGEDDAVVLSWAVIAGVAAAGAAGLWAAGKAADLVARKLGKWTGPALGAAYLAAKQLQQ